MVYDTELGVWSTMALARGGMPVTLGYWDINSESFPTFPQRALWPPNTEPQAL